MPAFSIQLDAETAALMGNFKEAAKQVEKEWKKVQNEINKDIVSGRGVDRKLADRSVQLREHADSLLARDKQKQEIAKVAKESTTKHIADLINVHNPHRQIGQALRGNVNANTFGSVGDMLKGLGSNSPTGRMLGSAGNALLDAAKGAGPAAMIAAMATKAVFEVLEARAADAQNGANVDLATNSKSFGIARANRFRGGADVTAMLLARHAAGEASSQAEHHGFVEDFMHGKQHTAESRAFAKDSFDFQRKFQGMLSAAEIQAQSLGMQADQARHKLDFEKSGVLGWLETLKDKFTGKYAADMEAYARKRAEDYMKHVEGVLERQKAEAIDNPAYQVAAVDAARNDAAAFHDRVDRFCQWNMA